MIHTPQQCHQTIIELERMIEETKDPINKKALEKSKIKWEKYKRKAQKEVSNVR
jgi:hypothetical protein